MLNALTEITGYRNHNLMQSMLFDANTTTPPHQDWWYLDTVPKGHLLGRSDHSVRPIALPPERSCKQLHDRSKH